MGALIGMVVGIPIGMWIWGLFGEKITAWLESKYDK